MDYFIGWWTLCFEETASTQMLPHFGSFFECSSTSSNLMTFWRFLCRNFIDSPENHTFIITIGKFYIVGIEKKTTTTTTEC